MRTIDEVQDIRSRRRFLTLVAVAVAAGGVFPSLAKGQIVGSKTGAEEKTDAYSSVKNYFLQNAADWQRFTAAVESGRHDEAFEIGRKAGLSNRDISYIITNSKSYERFNLYLTGGSSVMRYW